MVLTFNKRQAFVLVLVASLLVLTLAATVAGYVYRNPPLATPGTIWSNIDEGYAAIDLSNRGIFNICIEEILINGHETPAKVELGTSKSGLMVHMSGPDEHPDITFHSISEVNIKPELTGHKKDKAIEALLAGERGHIFHYGLLIHHDTPVKTVTIKYSYIGFTFKHIHVVRD